MSTSFSHNFDRFVFLMRMIFLYYLDQESHALMTDLENCLDQEVEKKVRLRSILVFIIYSYSHRLHVKNLLIIMQVLVPQLIMICISI